MRKFELPRPKIEPDDAEIERLLAEIGLTSKFMGSLRAYPGSSHWHAKLGSNNGVLEITRWNGDLWASVQGGREAPWIDEMIERLHVRLEQASHASGRIS